MILNFGSQSGEEFSLGGQIRKPAFPGQAKNLWPNYPTSAAGMTLRFTAKRRKTDTAYVARRDNVANGTEVTLANGGAWTVKILDGDTSAFTRTEELTYDVVLIEPSGEQTVVCEGTWNVEKSTGL